MIAFHITGRLGKDPETRQTQAGRSVTSVSVASTQKVGGEDRTTWVRATIWGPRGEAFARFHNKGSQCSLMGSLTTRAYDHNGERRESLELDVHNWTFVGPREERQGGGYAPSVSDDEAIPFAPCEVL